ncbi:MAG: DUF2237 family protein [Acetobacteraceae bacterium]
MRRDTSSLFSVACWPLKWAGIAGAGHECLSASRWQEALEAGKAPYVVLRAAHDGALEWCTRKDSQRHAIDLSWRTSLREASSAAFDLVIARSAAYGATKQSRAHGATSSRAAPSVIASRRFSRRLRAHRPASTAAAPARA